MSEVSNSYISIKDLSVWYPNKTSLVDQLLRKEKEWIKAVDDINISIQQGEILGVIGESGCGKSTLGKVLARLVNPTSGEVLIEGVSMEEMLKDDPKKFRRTVQIIFQNPFDTFTPRDTIQKILLRPLKLHNIGKNDDERIKMCIDMLESGGLKPATEIMKRFPHELSGGQLQRISILRSMMFKPKFIIADEPVSMLDVSVRADIINMLLTLSKENNTTLIFISHDIALTRYISDNIAVMYLGKVVEYGSAEQIINDPQHPYTKTLISNCASIDPEEVMEKIRIDGEPPTPVNPGPGCYFAARCFKAQPNCFEKYPETIYVDEQHLVACDQLERGDLSNVLLK